MNFLQPLDPYLQPLPMVFFGLAAFIMIMKALLWRFGSEETEECYPVPKPRIMEKVAKVNEDRANYLECLRADVCPACGGKLKEKVQGTADFSYHSCKSCGFKSPGEILY